jgi:hypothetical protein
LTAWLGAERAAIEAEVARITARLDALSAVEAAAARYGALAVSSPAGLVTQPEMIHQLLLEKF